MAAKDRFYCIILSEQGIKMVNSGQADLCLLFAYNNHRFSPGMSQIGLSLMRRENLSLGFRKK